MPMSESGLGRETTSTLQALTAPAWTTAALVTDACGSWSDVSRSQGVAAFAHPAGARSARPTTTAARPDPCRIVRPSLAVISPRAAPPSSARTGLTDRGPAGQRSSFAAGKGKDHFNASASQHRLLAHRRRDRRCRRLARRPDLPRPWLRPHRRHHPGRPGIVSGRLAVHRVGVNLPGGYLGSFVAAIVGAGILVLILRLLRR